MCRVLESYSMSVVEEAGLGRVGIWTASLDAVPPAAAGQVAAEREAQGWSDLLRRGGRRTTPARPDRRPRSPDAGGDPRTRGRQPPVSGDTGTDRRGTGGSGAGQDRGRRDGRRTHQGPRDRAAPGARPP